MSPSTVNNTPILLAVKQQQIAFVDAVTYLSKEFTDQLNICQNCSRTIWNTGLINTYSVLQVLREKTSSFFVFIAVSPVPSQTSEEKICFFVSFCSKLTLVRFPAQKHY
jgi:hypothetical protein